MDEVYDVNTHKRRLCVDQINFGVIGLEIAIEPDNNEEVEYIEINSLDFHKMFGFTPEEGLVLHVEARDGTTKARLEITERQRVLRARPREE